MYVIPSEPRSAISVAAWHDLLARQLIPRAVTAERCPLHALKLGLQPIPDLDVAIDPQLRDIGGVLGFDVFRNYENIGFDRERECYVLRR
jgi:hypothetical protein